MKSGKGKKVKIPLPSDYSATKVEFLTLPAKLTFTVVNAKKSKSGKYLNDENLIKSLNGRP